MPQNAVGQPIARVDGLEKVTGRAAYAGDIAAGGMLHAVMVQSAIARGTIEAIETDTAMRVPGVVAVFTHQNLPPVQPPPEQFTESFPGERRAPLSDNVIHYAGQHVALVVAETLEQAQEGAALVRVRYSEERPVLELRAGLSAAYRPDHFATNSEEKLQSERGTPGPAAHRLAAEYATPVETHNPIEPYATLAIWQADRLTLHDSTRWVQGSRKIVAHMLQVPEEKVRVICPFTGGAFGSKGFIWQHVALAAQAARVTGRPVRLELTRQQMFTSIGHRPRTRQTLEFASDDDGNLTSVRHDTLTETSPVAHFVEPAGMTSRNLYRTPHAAVSHVVAPVNLATPCFMRAPGESPGMFALESAMDELAEAAGLDPLEFRLRNRAERDLAADRPWSSRHLERCYREGAERFGWAQRNPAPASMKRGRKRIGWGMATAAYPGRRSQATVRAMLRRDGSAVFSAATQEIGCGMGTIMEQIAADELGLPLSQIAFLWGDSELSQAPVSGASQTTATVGSAVQEAARQLREAVFKACGRSGEIAQLAAELPRQELSVEASARLADELKKQYTFHSFGAHFAEVEVDPDLLAVQVTRWVSVMDAGRVLNPRTSRSQIMGGIVFGLGMALMEQTIYDQRTGAPVNANLADYLMPTCADAPPRIEISFIEEPDLKLDPLGSRGLGEIGITGVPAAIANAVWHATGVRVRELPITLDKLLAEQRRQRLEEGHSVVRAA